jgi:phospholipid transport system substrate-binding protein
VAAGAPRDQVRQTVDKLISILNDPQLKGEYKKNERRQKLKEVLYQRFDFTEMARRSLGVEWRRRTPEEQKEFVRLFTDLLERAYLDKIESYSGEKFYYLKEREDGNYAEVDTKIIDKTGQGYSLDYRLYKVNGDWKVYDVIIEDVSLVGNYRSQFGRVLAKSSFDELLKTMKEKTFSAPGSKSWRPRKKPRHVLDSSELWVKCTKEKRRRRNVNRRRKVFLASLPFVGCGAQAWRGNNFLPCVPGVLAREIMLVQDVQIV